MLEVDRKQIGPEQADDFISAETIAGRAGWVQRLTGRTGLSPGLETEQLVFASVAEP